MNQKHLTQIAQLAADLSGDASMAESVVKHDRATRFVSALADRRVSSGLTQKDIASRMGVSVSTISRLEDSCDADVRLGDLISYANAVGINVSLLMEDSSLPVAARIKNCVLLVSEGLQHLAQLASKSQGDRDIIDGINRFRGEVLYNFLLRFVESGVVMPRISYAPEESDDSQSLSPDVTSSSKTREKVLA